MKPDVKKLVILNLPYLIFVYLFGKCGQAYRLAAGADLSGKLLHLADGFTAAFANPLPSLHLFDFCVGIAGALIVRLVVYCKGKNAKKYRKGVEYGSARWGTARILPPTLTPNLKTMGYTVLLCFCLFKTAASVNPYSRRIKNQLHTGGNHLFQHITSFTPIRRGGMSAKTNRVQRKITIPP